MKKMSIPASKKAERLYKEIRAFKLWADKNYPDRSEENDNGEWQFAKRLAGCDPCKDLIFVFIESEDEYTSRMALETMAKIDQKKAEEYAVRFWNRGKYPEGSYEDEYQKIMVLHVLNTVGSGKLNDYLKESLNMPYKWLKENAEEILNNETKEVGNET